MMTLVTNPRAQPKSSSRFPIAGYLSKVLVLLTFTFYLFYFVLHCTWVTSNAYSSPSVVLASRNPDGSQHIIDDYREAYYWLRMNTPEDAKVMAWWDYGYQIGVWLIEPHLLITIHGITHILPLLVRQCLPLKMCRMKF